MKRNLSNWIRTQRKTPTDNFLTKHIQMHYTQRDSVQRIDSAQIGENAKKREKPSKKSKNTPILAIFIP